MSDEEDRFARARDAVIAMMNIAEPGPRGCPLPNDMMLVAADACEEANLIRDAFQIRYRHAVGDRSRLGDAAVTELGKVGRPPFTFLERTVDDVRGMRLRDVLHTMTQKIHDRVAPCEASKTEGATSIDLVIVTCLDCLVRTTGTVGERFIGFEKFRLEPGVVVGSEVYCRGIAKLRRLYIPSEIAQRLHVVSLSVDSEPVLLEAVPAELFAWSTNPHDENMSPLRSARSGEIVRVEVENVSDTPVAEVRMAVAMTVLIRKRIP